MYYSLVDPEGTERELKRRMKCLTIKECAERVGIDPGALSRALRGQRVWPQTVRAIAEAIQRDPLDIAQET